MFLQRLEDAGHRFGGGSRHIIRIYTEVFRIGGPKTHVRLDPDPFVAGIYTAAQEVYRLYMEYCEGGDLAGEIHNMFPPAPLAPPPPAPPPPAPPQTPPTEELVWRVFGCLAKAISLLGTGNENALPGGVANWGGAREILHLDVKSDNGPFPVLRECLFCLQSKLIFCHSFNKPA